MIVVDWVGHDDGSTAVMVRSPGDYYDEEEGTMWDSIIRDWETLK